MSTDGVAILRDERDLLWLMLDDFRAQGDDRIVDVHFLARDDPNQPPVPFLSAWAVVEPAAGLQSLAESVGGMANGEVRALRHDPIGPGLSMELKAGDRVCEVVLWMDLVQVSPALKARAARGRHQAGLRMFVTLEALQGFRAGLLQLAYAEE